MTFFEYCKDKIMLLLLQAGCMGGSFFFFRLCGVQRSQLLLFFLAWFFTLTVWFFLNYRRRKDYFQTIYAELKQLKQPYLISEIMPMSHRMEDGLYREILRISNKSVMDAIHHLETQQKEYKEFIENWIHEVKLPLTVINLICDSQKNEETRRIRVQLARLENDVEKALYYARSDNVYQDYRIHKINLKETVLEAIGRNRQYFIQNDVMLTLECDDISISCDEKWLEFILNQILINAVKYKKEEGCRIIIEGRQEKDRVRLVIEDNGIGIKEEEAGRIFDKGFTGTNGRGHIKSTGIGLYLCRKLCRKLGIAIEAESKEGEYTRVYLDIPDGSSYYLG